MRLVAEWLSRAHTRAPRKVEGVQDQAAARLAAVSAQSAARTSCITILAAVSWRRDGEGLVYHHVMSYQSVDRG